MKYWVYTPGRYRAMSILGRVPVAFFNCYQFAEMTYMPGEIILTRMMTALDLDVKKAMHYHEDRYGSDNHYGLPPLVMRPLDIYSVFTTEASFNPD